MRIYYAYAFMFALVLAACSTTPTSAPQTIYQVEANYNTAAQVIVAYKSLPPCPSVTVLCSDSTVVAKLKQADSIAYAALVAAENTVRTPGAGANAATATAAANEAVKALTAITAVLQTK